MRVLMSGLCMGKNQVSIPCGHGETCHKWRSQGVLISERYFQNLSEFHTGLLHLKENKYDERISGRAL
jgi:hypothetical protein